MGRLGALTPRASVTNTKTQAERLPSPQKTAPLHPFPTFCKAGTDPALQQDSIRGCIPSQKKPCVSGCLSFPLCNNPFSSSWKGREWGAAMPPLDRGHYPMFADCKAMCKSPLGGNKTQVTLQKLRTAEHKLLRKTRFLRPTECSLRVQPAPTVCAPGCSQKPSSGSRDGRGAHWVHAQDSRGLPPSLPPRHRAGTGARPEGGGAGRVRRGPRAGGREEDAGQEEEEAEAAAALAAAPAPPLTPPPPPRPGK